MISWIKNKLLKGYVKSLLDKLSWKLNGKKSIITGVALALLVVIDQKMCGAYCDYAQSILNVLADTAGTTPDELKKATVVAYAVSLLHKWTKIPEENT